jgi:hypothetical protein
MIILVICNGWRGCRMATIVISGSGPPSLEIQCLAQPGRHSLVWLMQCHCQHARA